MDDIKYDYIIYHRNCLDGFTGFYLFMKTKYWSPKPIVFSDVPSAREPPPNIKDKNVIIIDVAYDLHIIKHIANNANSMLFIDHHISIRDDIKQLRLQDNQKLHFDINKSGASLVWDYFYKNKELPRFVKYIEDNDIGRWQYPETLNFIVGMEVNFKMDPTYDNLREWDKLLNDDFLTSLIERGRIYNEYKEHLITRYSNKYSVMKFSSRTVINKYKQFNNVGQYTVAITNTGCPSVSLVGKRIMENNDKIDFCILWFYIPHLNKYSFALRSKEGKADVGSIAKIFGGGGHTHASGFVLYKDQLSIEDMFIKL
jgi:oligoribonuclease NrnB/cAMP/cGMP phosphodiesterase (DHH superfamily)